MSHRLRFGLWWARIRGKDSYAIDYPGGSIYFCNLQGKPVTWGSGYVPEVTDLPFIPVREGMTTVYFKYDSEAKKWEYMTFR